MRGLSQRELAELAGIRRTDVVKIESGKNKLTKVSRRRAVADALRVPLTVFDDYLNGTVDFEEAVRAAPPN